MVGAMTSLAMAGASVAILASQPSFRANVMAALAKWTGYDALGKTWRLAVILLALANLKNLPFVWHLRFCRAFFYQLYFQPTAIPPRALFQPIITSTRTTMWETDYNLHKSNSTYFSDMDISRTHLFTAIIRNGIKKTNRTGANAVMEAAGATEGTRGKHMIALGGISCQFKKEILPYRRYEIWTRLLSWDRKWFYLVTFLVKPGVGKPSSWTLQPWKKSKPAVEHVDPTELKNAIHATAIAKYVIKRGRITVPPEQALLHADMVPPKPEGWIYRGEKPSRECADGDVDEVLSKIVTAEEWNWDTIEAERLKGFEVAQKFAEIDTLHEHFDGGKDGVLGEFSDLLF